MIKYTAEELCRPHSSGQHHASRGEITSQLNMASSDSDATRLLLPHDSSWTWGHPQWKYIWFRRRSYFLISLELQDRMDASIQCLV